MSAAILIAIVAILIAWLISCYFVAYSYVQIGINDDDDINLNLASKYLGYASLSSWVLIVIAIIIFILAIIILVLLLIFGGEVAIPSALKFIKSFFKNLSASFSKNKKVSASFTALLWFLLVLAVILTFLTGLYSGIAAYYINKGVYTEDSANAIQQSLKYCYYTAFISILVIIIIIGVIFAKIYFGIESKKKEKKKEQVNLDLKKKELEISNKGKTPKK